MTTSVAERDAPAGDRRANRNADRLVVSSWSHRVPIVVLCGVGLGIASYLAAYQMRIIGKIWDPIFGSGSEIVLRSFVSRLLPLPDALLGVFGYAAEAIGALIGGTSRWRTHPRFVCAYGGLVLFLAIVAIALTGVQLFVLRVGCTLCLCSALVSLIIPLLAFSEIAAAWRSIHPSQN